MPDTQQQFFDDLQPGDHLCSIYKDEDHRFSTLVTFFQIGLTRHERCIYVLDMDSREEVISAFEKKGIDIKEFMRSGQFLLLTTQETYLRDDRFDPDRMLAYWNGAEQDALKGGYAGIRISGETTWALERAGDRDELLKYEARVNGALAHTTIIALCQYDETRFDPETLAEAIHTHPSVVIHGIPSENFYYAPDADGVTHTLPKGAYILIRDDLMKTAQETT